MFDAKDNLGVVAVAFDAKTSGVAYASVSGAGLYRSTDNGANWQLLPGAPGEVRRLLAANDGALWVTHAIGVSKYAGGKWQEFTPGGQPDPYCGIAVNPHDPQDVLVSDLERAIKPPETGRLYRTFDGGATWKRLPAVHVPTVPWSREYSLVRVSALAFNPANTQQVWGVSGAGVLRTDNIEAGLVEFPSVEAGHEETCIKRRVIRKSCRLRTSSPLSPDLSTRALAAVAKMPPQKRNRIYPALFGYTPPRKIPPLFTFHFSLFTFHFSLFTFYFSLFTL